MEAANLYNNWAADWFQDSIATGKDRTIKPNSRFTVSFKNSWFGPSWPFTTLTGAPYYLYVASAIYSRGVQPLDLPGPHWKKSTCLGLHIKYTNK